MLSEVENEEINDYADATSFSSLIDSPLYSYDDPTENQADDYDDFNEYFRISLAKKAPPKKDPFKYLDTVPGRLEGKKWYSNSLFKKTTVQQLYNITKNFLAKLTELDFSKTTRPKSLKNKLYKARVALKRADRYYSQDQPTCVYYIVEALMIGKAIVEELAYCKSVGKDKK